jgi:hypothetical protein
MDFMMVRPSFFRRAKANPKSLILKKMPKKLITNPSRTGLGMRRLSEVLNSTKFIEEQMPIATVLKLDENTAILVVHNIGNIVNVPELKRRFSNTIIIKLSYQL